MTSNELIPELADFLQAVDGIYGLYLDAITSFYQWRKNFMEIQQRVSLGTGMVIAELDEKPFAYGHVVSQEELIPDHTSSQREFKERLEENGLNYRSMANFCVVLIYQYWEYYRAKIEKKSNLSKDGLKSDLMGDIRFYRHSIIHNKGISKANMKKCKVLPWFKKGDEINITKSQFKYIIKQIKKEMIEISKKIIKWRKK